MTYYKLIPIKLLNNEENCTIDNIVTVCCALCNLSESVIPFLKNIYVYNYVDFCGNQENTICLWVRVKLQP